MIDAHAHYEPRLLSEMDLLQLLKNENIEHMVLVPLLTNPPESTKPALMMSIQRWMFSFDLLRPLAIWITKQMYKSEGKWNLGPLSWFMKSKASTLEIVQKPDHAPITSLVQKYPDRFSQWLFINPKQTSIAQFRHLLNETPKVVGIKLHPFWHNFALRDLDGYIEVIREFRLPVNIHLGYGPSGDFHYLLQRYPDVKFVFGHLGVPYYKALWREIAMRPNCFLDVSSTYHVDERLLRNAVNALGAERILFASDTPYTTPGSIGVIRDWIKRLPLSSEEKDNIFSKNFQRLRLNQ